MLLILLLWPAVAARNAFVSSPFDNFRMECPKRAAAIDVSIRMVESVGAKRQDVVFDMSCEAVEELFPWVNIPTGISEIEREDCYYSAMFDPILDETTDFSCKRREYVAGIARLTDTRLQILCCRLRSRDEFNCRETPFNKPIGLSKSTIIEHENQLINAIRIENQAYVVRFCDLAPRNIADIYGDTKKATTRKHTVAPKSTTKVGKKATKSSYVPPSTTRMPQISSTPTTPSYTMPSTSFFTLSTRTTTSIPLTSRTAPNPNLPRQVPIEIRLDGEDTFETINSQDTTVPSTSTLASPTTQRFESEPTPQSTEIVSTTGTQGAQNETSSPLRSTLTYEVMDSVKENVDHEDAIETTASDSTVRIEDIIRELHKASSKSAERLFKETIANLLDEQKSTDSGANNNVNDLSQITFPDKEFPKSNEKKFAIPAKLKISKADLPLKVAASPDDFLFLHTINTEGHRRAPIRTHRPHVETWSSKETDGDSWKQTTVESSISKKEPTVYASSSEEPATASDSELQTDGTGRLEITTTSASRRDLPSSRKALEFISYKVDNAHSIDEETKTSPFEDENQVPKDSQRNSGINRSFELRGDEDIEEVINKLSASGANIRRAPMRNSIPRQQKIDTYAEDIQNSSLEDGIAKMKRKDGNKTVIPKGFQPILMPEMTIFEKQHSEDSIMEEMVKASQDAYREAENHAGPRQSKSEEQKELIENLILVNSKTFIGERDTTVLQETSTSTTDEDIKPTLTTVSRVSSTNEYNPALFYHTPVPKPLKKEKVLTFCTKDVALRDGRNMVIACGGEMDVWYPARCPQGADCFLSEDSTYRLCCPISSG